jgi:phage gpG-like protein
LDNRFEFVGGREMVINFTMLEKQLPGIVEKGLKAAGTFIKGIVLRKLSGEVLNRRSSHLANSITVETIENRQAVSIGTNIIYGRIHEFGGVIRPVNFDYLHFKVNGNWVMTKEVNMPARPYLQPSLNEGKDGAVVRMNRIIAEDIAKRFRF